MSTPHHCRYATVGSKSDSEGGFWTDSDVQMWGSVITQKGQQRDLRIVSSLQARLLLSSMPGLYFYPWCKKKLYVFTADLSNTFAVREIDINMTEVEN